MVTLAKIVPLLIFIVALPTLFDINTFKLDFWDDVELGSVPNQVKSTMLAERVNDSASPLNIYLLSRV